jgi:GT2 family glycosyltransferase
VRAGPEISAIIPVRDGEAQLPALLASLAAQTLAPERFEVIVVDNASRDSTAEVARRGGAKVVHEPVPNRSRARNRGAGAARSDLLAFTDVDCVAEPGWLEAMLRCAGTAPLLAGPVHVTTRDRPNAVERFERLWRFSQESAVKEGWAATANLYVERRAFESVGGLDPAYRFGEDVDLCIRATRAGFALGFCPDAVVTHPAEQRPRPMLRRAFFHGYAAGQVRRRIGVGQDAWRDLRPLIRGGVALERMGLRRPRMDPREWRRMDVLARLAYAARIAGSLWSTVSRAR